MLIKYVSIIAVILVIQIFFVLQLNNKLDRLNQLDSRLQFIQFLIVYENQRNKSWSKIIFIHDVSMQRADQPEKLFCGMKPYSPAIRKQETRMAQNKNQDEATFKFQYIEYCSSMSVGNSGF